jgi:hypothetical protein
MDASRTLRPLAVTAAAGLLLTGAACNGRLARRASQSQTPATAVTTVVTPTTAPSAGAASASQPVRTDDLDAGLQQADTQLSQTGGALSDADQPSQQNSD